MRMIDTRFPRHFLPQDHSETSFHHSLPFCPRDVGQSTGKVFAFGDWFLLHAPFVQAGY